ncbi:E3 SUMO-protein ligase ZBED1-like [Hemicordylus capensis]|uniref:E3 SUMO-protein ligase ZBED1-like n=1 Tax=Hemicordylus capensis TaxID=884348 RepID=UPI00230359E6|nr:E3 SUMO-protein ligase ZBED1-like [Hemicordylus capensis]XP_053145885.1 E3 SUMO-protein ligase ZBED1-like [Hemicordylus capensis]
MITTDMLPVSVIEGTGFRALMSFVKPEYCVPERQTITSQLEKCYEQSVKSLQEKLENAVQVVLATDCWTALSTECYMTVTCYYIEDWELQSAVLHTESMAERDTAENLAEKLNSTAERWGLAGRVLACVHDNASKMSLDVLERAVTWESVCCFADSLQQAINDGFSASGVDHIVAAANRLVSHFHRSTVAAEALERKQTQLQLKQHRLIQLCKTHWDSVYDMFERLCEQRSAVTGVLSDSCVTNQSDAQMLQLQEEHWQLIEEILPVLSSLKCATAAMSDELSVSISNIYPVCNSLLQKHLQSETPVKNRKVAYFKTALHRFLEHHLQPNNPAITAKPALIASLLDPRHKHLQFLLPVIQITAKSKLLQLASMVEIEELPRNTAMEQMRTELDEPEPVVKMTTESDEPEPAAKKRRETEAIMMLLGEDYTKQEYERNAVENEVEKYFREPCPSLKCSPLEWWKVNAQRFPRLAKLAKGYLCIPASFVPTECVCSNVSLTVNHLRARLAPEHVNMLIFLNKNQ